MTAPAQVSPAAASGPADFGWSRCWDFEKPQRGDTAASCPSGTAPWWSCVSKASAPPAPGVGAPPAPRWPDSAPAAARGATSRLNPAFIDTSDSSDVSDDDGPESDRGIAALRSWLALSQAPGATKSTRSPISSTPTRSASTPTRSAASPRSGRFSPPPSSPQASTRAPSTLATPSAATPGPRAILRLEECLAIPGRLEEDRPFGLLAQAVSRLSAPPPGLEPWALRRAFPEVPPLPCLGRSVPPLPGSGAPPTLKLSRGDRQKVVPTQREYQGTLKMVSEVHGYGFIACKELREAYQRDTYLPKALVPPGVQVGDTLVFTMGLSSKGRPMVTKVSIVV